MNPKEILAELRRLVDLTEIEITPLPPDSGFKSAYGPINTYLGQLQKDAKPETAAEGLFRPLAEVFFNAPVVPQVGIGSGFQSRTGRNHPPVPRAPGQISPE